ncbi:MAG: hypothetical protein JJE35_14800, partial [Thermoleophilia bacterium]|nr:hypothetical protein [Thermoleophilia bacterium]
MPRVHLLGVGATSLSREVRDARWLAHDAVTAALADAGLDGSEVDALAVAAGEASAMLGCREAIGHPVRSTDCEGAHGAVALHAAWTAVATGESDVVLCVGQDPPPAFGAGTIPVEALAASVRLYMRESGATEDHLALVAAKNRGHGASNPRALVRRAVGAATVMASAPLAWPLRQMMVAAPAQASAAVVLSCRDLGRSGPRAPRLPA